MCAHLTQHGDRRKRSEELLDAQHRSAPRPWVPSLFIRYNGMPSSSDGALKPMEPSEKATSNGFPRRSISTGNEKITPRSASPGGIGPNLLVEGSAASKSLPSSSPASARETFATPASAREPRERGLAEGPEEEASEVERLRKLVMELQSDNEQLAAQLRASTGNDPRTKSGSSGTPTRAAAHINELRAIKGEGKHIERRISAESTFSTHSGHSAKGRKKQKNQLWDGDAPDGESSDEAEGVDEDEQSQAKTEDQKKLILTALKQRAPFDSLAEEVQLLLTDAMILKRAKAGEVIIQEGDPRGRHCYVLAQGEVTVTVKGESRGTMQKGSIFGELSLFYNMPRTATIIAASDLLYFALNRKTFRATLREETISQRREVFEFLKSCALFNNMSQRELARIADAIQPKGFKEGNVIVQEGDTADGMYFVKDGQVVVKQSAAQNDEKAQNILGILKAGDYFGERALLTDDPRSASVEALTDTVCLQINKEAFLKLLGPLHAELKSAMPALPSPRGLRRHSSEGGGGSSNALVPKMNRYAPRMEMLQVCKPLGAGGFARVVMVRDKFTRRLYALKTISKKALVAKNAAVRTASALHEKHCLAELNHPFILSLISSYQDQDHLYLLLTLAMGGELFRVMEEYDKLSEPMACFYIASVTLALQHIHLMEYVYRDLKPENVMIDQLGFIKVCDFGFAKKVQDRTFTQCGTPDYVAPEMLKGQGVNQACDWWALGVLLYEMIASVPPFSDPNGEDMATFANILKGEVKYPPEEEDNFSDDCKSLIAGLLTLKVSDRLGYLKEGAEDLVGHKWFKGKIDWDALINLTVKPPWVPELKCADDTTYFDQEAMEECEQMHKSMKGSLSEEEDAKWAHVWQAFEGPPPPPSPSKTPSASKTTSVPPAA